MRTYSPSHRLWLWWTDRYWTLAGREFALPMWPWRIFCAVRGHSATDDQCRKPEHRYCWVCNVSTPFAEVS